MSLVVARVLGLATVQDHGRSGFMHEGLPHGGALVPELLACANRNARNPDDAAAIEVLGRLVVRATAPIELATDSSDLRTLHAGDELAIASEPRRVAYLAIRGGVDAPLVLGSRSTHASAGLGGPLAAGATITAGSAPPRDAAGAPFAAADTIRIIPGPDVFPAAALATLVSLPFRISPSSDRVGTRLDGPALAHTVAERSRPLARGAIEVPRDGQPIVLGPEHPTTGGYPVIAVIAHADLGRFFAIRLGGTVRFRV